MGCAGDNCPAFVQELDKCLIEILKGRLLQEMRVKPVESTSMSVADAMKPELGLPNVSEIQWYVGGGESRYDARPDDEKAWAFVYKYDATAKQPTDVIRDECVELVGYLHTNDSLEMDGYKFFLSGKDKNFLGRNLVK